VFTDRFSPPCLSLCFEYEAPGVLVSNGWRNKLLLNWAVQPLVQPFMLIRGTRACLITLINVAQTDKTCGCKDRSTLPWSLCSQADDMPPGRSREACVQLL
jgi:hypothetical protein